MLKIKFSNEVLYIVELHASFYLSPKGDKVSKADIIEKIKGIAYDFEKNPDVTILSATLTLGNQESYYIGPNPVLKEEPEEKIDYSLQLRDYKKSAKEFKFTRKIRYTSDGLQTSML